MKRIIFISMALWLVLSCGGKKEEGALQQAQKSTQEKKPVQMIPDEEFTEFEKLAQAFIRPYFDVSGTLTERTVKAGEPFELYVVAEYNPLYPMSAAEYCLVLPEGVTVMGSANSDSTLITLGKHDDDFMIAFRCSSGPKLWLVKYTCLAAAGTSGGTVSIEMGHDQKYLGFTMCDAQRTMIKAKPGTAQIKVE
jgi:hypothetical protein